MGRGRKRTPDQGNDAGVIKTRGILPVSFGGEGERDTQAHGLPRDEMWKCASEKLSFKWHLQI